jgi:hypothetical protein
MHFHLPKPLHGWRAFAGEVGIIVVGVLIALGAEQVVQSFTWHRDVRDFRAAVDTELDFNLAAGDYRVRQSPCAERRLAELERWSAAQRAGQAMPLLREIGFPRRITPDTAVWSSRGADLPAHVPIEARLAYSDLYDLLANQWELIEGERETWLSLNGFNHVSKLGPEDLVRLDELVFRAKTLDRFIVGDQHDFEDDTVGLGLRRSFGRLASQISPPPADFCKPLLPMPTGKRA